MLVWVKIVKSLEVTNFRFLRSLLYTYMNHMQEMRDSYRLYPRVKSIVKIFYI